MYPLELYSDGAPGHVSNLIALVKAGFAISYILQGYPRFHDPCGCPEGTGIGGPGYTIDAEFQH